MSSLDQLSVTKKGETAQRAEGKRALSGPGASGQRAEKGSVWTWGRWREKRRGPRRREEARPSQKAHSDPSQGPGEQEPWAGELESGL